MIIFASFDYRGSRVDILAVGPSSTPALTCPACFKTRSLRRHLVLLGPSGLPSITPSIFCPDPACHWHVSVSNGRASDVPEDVQRGSAPVLVIRTRLMTLPGRSAARQRPTVSQAGVRHDRVR